MKPILIMLAVVYLVGTIIYAIPQTGYTEGYSLSFWRITDAITVGTTWPVAAAELIVDQF